MSGLTATSYVESIVAPSIRWLPRCRSALVRGELWYVQHFRMAAARNSDRPSEPRLTWPPLLPCSYPANRLRRPDLRSGGVGDRIRAKADVGGHGGGSARNGDGAAVSRGPGRDGRRRAERGRARP